MKKRGREWMTRAVLAASNSKMEPEPARPLNIPVQPDGAPVKDAAVRTVCGSATAIASAGVGAK